MPLGSSRPRVAHAHPLTADARASRAAVAFRRADREAARIQRRATPVRLAIPATALVAIAAAVLLASQPLAPVPLAATSTGDRSGMGAGGAGATVTPGATPAPTAAPPLAAGPATRPAVDDPLPASNGYRWPVEHARITQAFGPSRGGLFIVAGHEFHDGIDIANFCGAPILAAHDGRVIAASRHVVAELGWTGDLAAYDAYLTSKGLWGSQARVIVIDDGNGFRSVYIHMHRIDVKVGQVVQAGQQIGLEGSSGHATGCHLHYAIYSPTDRGRWQTNPKDVARYHLPSGEIAHVNPIDLLPPAADGSITWGWGTSPPQD